MKIRIDWQPPEQLTEKKEIIIDPKDISERIENRPGVYFFSRKFGDVYTPFYIGETKNLRNRLKAHLETTKIADVLRGIKTDKRIKNGIRYFHYGYLIAGQGQQTKKCLQIVQKYLIRQAVEAELPILNGNLTTYPTHTLLLHGNVSGRTIYYPKETTIEAD